jgi:NDP-sugar pyrophosphorylase family protein
MIDDKIRAMVLAAGVGSRLQPLSDVVPKPLIKIGGRTIMDHILLLLKKHGITNVVSNTHHLADQIHEHFTDIKTKEGIDIQFLYEEKLSGVAGGIRLCQDFLKQSTACIIMGDALTDVDLTDLYLKHKEAVKNHGCLATVAQMQVKDTGEFGVIVTEALLDKDSETPNRIVKFQEKPKASEALSNWANTGIYFFEPRIYEFIPSTENAPKYDVARDLFPKLLNAGEYIQAIAIDPQTYWADLGTPTQYIKSVQDITEGRVDLDFLDSIDSSAEIDPSANIEGFNEIGKNTKIGKNVIIKDCIIWDNVVIGENTKLEDCIIGSNTKIPANQTIDKQVLTAESSRIQGS